MSQKHNITKLIQSVQTKEYAQASALLKKIVESKLERRVVQAIAEAYHDNYEPEYGSQNDNSEFDEPDSRDLTEPDEADDKAYKYNTASPDLRRVRARFYQALEQITKLKSSPGSVTNHDIAKIITSVLGEERTQFRFWNAVQSNSPSYGLDVAETILVREISAIDKQLRSTSQRSTEDEDEDEEGMPEEGIPEDEQPAHCSIRNGTI